LWQVEDFSISQIFRYLNPNQQIHTNRRCLYIFKATWFGAEKFCHKRGWLLGELLGQRAEMKEFAQQTQGLLGIF
jgi:hypothetical protein